MGDPMKNRFLKGIAVTAALAFSATGLAITPAHAANEIVVWADETRGPNLASVIKAKGDWVPGLYNQDCHIFKF